MAYDEDVVDRVRSALGKRKGVVEKQMFGGLTFMVNGKMCCGVTQDDDLMLRIGPERRKKLSNINTSVRATSPDVRSKAWSFYLQRVTKQTVYLKNGWVRRLRLHRRCRGSKTETI